MLGAGWDGLGGFPDRMLSATMGAGRCRGRGRWFSTTARSRSVSIAGSVSGTGCRVRWTYVVSVDLFPIFLFKRVVFVRVLGWSTVGVLGPIWMGLDILLVGMAVSVGYAAAIFVLGKRGRRRAVGRRRVINGDVYSEKQPTID